MPAVEQTTIQQYHTPNSSMSRAFSLIELLIVIAIIALFAFLSFEVLQKQESKTEAHTIEKLRVAFADSIPSDKELICVDKCSKCFIKSSSSTTLQESPSHLKDIKAYVLDANDNPEQIEFGRLDDHPICLRFRYYANGSNTQIILGSEEKFFYIPSYFGDVEVFESLEDASDKWTENTKLASDRGNYY